MVQEGNVQNLGDNLRQSDYVLFAKPNLPIAIVEAKDANHTVSHGIQQALTYAEKMDVPFVFSTNGEGFCFHNRLAADGEPVVTTLTMDGIPSPDTLWEMYVELKHLTVEQRLTIDEPYYTHDPDK